MLHQRGMELPPKKIKNTQELWENITHAVINVNYRSIRGQNRKVKRYECTER